MVKLACLNFWVEFEKVGHHALGLNALRALLGSCWRERNNRIFETSSLLEYFCSSVQLLILLRGAIATSNSFVFILFRCYSVGKDFCQ